MKQSFALTGLMTDGKTQILETDNLKLRVFELNDLNAYAAIENNPEVLRHLNHGPRTLDRIQVSLAYYIQLQERHGYSIWAVEHADRNKLIGYCGLIPQSLGGKTEVELVYLFDPAYWNRGYATEAAVEVRDWAFVNLRSPRVISIIDPLNVAAVRVAEKTGMRYVQNVEYAGKDCRIYAVSRPGFV